MIICHKHKFIFLKTSKTAGTSTEIALSKFCGPDDVITTTDEPDEKIRRSLGYPGPQNYLWPVSEWRMRDYIRLVRRRPRREKYKHHDTAAYVKNLVGNDIWESYYKFCTVRNPYERFVSYYYNMHPEPPRPTMHEFLNRGIKELNENGLDVYTIDGEVAVDKLCLYENLAEDMEAVRLRIGLADRIELPNAKSNFRKDKRRYTEHLDEELIESIRKAFAWEIETFGYGS
ncbi:MAG: sulfotransferase family 2 domain-containing protein [Myxococcota bacterium]|jgi:hypothetical protein